MFTALTWVLKLAIYIGAPFTVLSFALSGPELVALMGLALEETPLAYGIGALAGLFTAAIIFGIPIVLLNINANLALAVELLAAAQSPRVPSLSEIAAPALVEGAFRAWNDA